jgi:hypothetical protein
MSIYFDTFISVFQIGPADRVRVCRIDILMAWSMRFDASQGDLDGNRKFS